MKNKKEKLKKGKRLKEAVVKRKESKETKVSLDISVIEDNYHQICRMKEEWENDNAHRSKVRDELEKVPGNTFAEKLRNVAEKAREVAESEKSS